MRSLTQRLLLILGLPMVIFYVAGVALLWQRAVESLEAQGFFIEPGIFAGGLSLLFFVLLGLWLLLLFRERRKGTRKGFEVVPRK